MNLHFEEGEWDGFTGFKGTVEEFPDVAVYAEELEDCQMELRDVIDHLRAIRDFDAS